MARVVTYHPTLKQLVYSPAPEYDKLHGASLAKLGPTPLSANKPLSLGSWAAGAGNSSDILVSFSRPTSACKLGTKSERGVCDFPMIFRVYSIDDRPCASKYLKQGHFPQVSAFSQVQ
jgi:hypothetical protein|eukprot:COSAG02_NODE_3286_length_7006_cov_2.000434_9_plen_118_part_00